MTSTPIGDPRQSGEQGPAGDQRAAGESGPAGDPREGGQATLEDVKPSERVADSDKDAKPPKAAKKVSSKSK